MAIHLSKEMIKLKKNILHLCATVEESVRQAVHSVIEHDVEEAALVKKKDREINSMEIDIEEECLKILALHQPVATDLRYVIACLKMNNDLERIGDLAENIARRAIAIEKINSNTPIPLDFNPMMEKTRKMLKKSLDSLISINANMASEVMAEDDILDEYNKQMHIDVAKLIQKQPEQTEYYLNLLSVSKHLERIGDYCTNIAEDVIYMARGEIVRHSTNE